MMVFEYQLFADHFLHQSPWQRVSIEKKGGQPPQPKANPLSAFFWTAMLCFLFAGQVARAGTAQVQLGIDRLKESNFKVLKGKKVGLVIHPASMDSKSNKTLDHFRSTDQCQLVAIYGPEHGVYGDEYAGVEVPHRKDARTGLAVFSLYGKTRKPTAEMLKEIDVLVFDLQDIGSRSYTFISTMKACLEACVENQLEFVVLDRPNPLGGMRIEGPGVQKEFESFVSALDVPYVHGMTMGELARLVKDRFFPNYEKLTVVKMEGWKRDMIWEDTGLCWIPTSPHIPHASSCAAYATTGILGELEQISVGVGYTLPFELVGAPWVQGDALAKALNEYWSDPKKAYAAMVTTNDSTQGIGSTLKKLEAGKPEGLYFRSASFKPFYALHKTVGCQGVQIYLDSKKAENLVEMNFRFIEVFGASELFAKASANGVSMFDKVCGSDEPRKCLIEQKDLGSLFVRWRQSCEQFGKDRRPYLLY